MIKKFLQGSWLKHPLHPALVHIPVGLWTAALVFDILSRTQWGGNAMVRTSFYAIAIGLFVVLLAVPTGVADWWDIKRDKPAWLLGVYHMILNFVAAAVWTLNLFWRWPELNASAVAAVPLTLSIVGTILLFISSYLGGRMTFAYGVSVARNSKGEWRALAERGKSRLPSAGGSGENS
jgi:uncharacterized membrane protein